MSQSVDLELPEQLTVAHVQGLHELLETIVDNEDNDTVVIKAENVSRADTAGVQLLYAFVQAAQDRQINLDWHRPSDAIKDVVNILGLSDQMCIN